jgi:uncharacterized protein
MNRKRALLALLLMVPAPSLGVWCGMILLPDSPVGAGLFAFSKLWLFGLPVVWRRFVEHAPLSLSPARQGGLMAGLLTGLLLSGLILAGYWTLGASLIDRQFLLHKLTAVGLGTHGRYLGGAVYWIGVNSVLEEYVWRWFCLDQCEQVFPKRRAVVCSALFFTLHHIVALQVYLGWTAVAICGLGVFLGGAIWSVMYLRYRSIWPGYLSHALVDACIFGIGAAILFGVR